MPAMLDQALLEFFPPTDVMNFETLRALDCFNLFTVFMPSHRKLLPYNDSYHIL